MNLNFPSNDADPQAQQPLTLGYWTRLSSQMDRLQLSLDQLLAETQASGDQVAALTRFLTEPARTRPLDERLTDLLGRQEASQEQWSALARGLDDLTQAVTRLNRTQFRSQALAEVKDQQVAAALGTLQAIATRREQVQEARALQAEERLDEVRVEARGELAADLLPAVDALDLALASGHAMLERHRQQEAAAAAAAQEALARPAEPTRPPGLWQRLIWALFGRGQLPPWLPAQPLAAPRPGPSNELAEALAAWLAGLEMVRTRFLGILAAVDIHPIPAEGQPFDPRVHLAMSVEARGDTPDGPVVNVLRKGYRQQGRVLRYAEVVVSRAPEAPAEGTEAEAVTADTGAAPPPSLSSESNSETGEFRSTTSEPIEDVFQ
jgi:molecular chaperone GrpE